MRPDEFEQAVKPIAESLGIKVEAEIDERDGYTLKARFPVRYQRVFIDAEPLMAMSKSASKAFADAVSAALESLQKAVFEHTYEHLAKHDKSDKAQSFRRIAKQALELAMQFTPVTHQEYGELEYLYEYVTRSR